MQRLYSMFPTAAPGVALLLLRAALALPLLDGALGASSAVQSPWAVAASWVAALGLVLGFLTPVVALVALALEVGVWFASGQSLSAVHLCAVIVAAALALLGPGGYSVDARLFGRRRIRLAPPPDDVTRR
jgi:uncharacterized membrane protein YphA (DoxX/SURF4 family)